LHLNRDEQRREMAERLRQRAMLAQQTTDHGATI
jgi:hypothetical protein